MKASERDPLYRELGLDPRQVTEEATLSARHGHRIWRIRVGDSTFVVKCFPNAASAVVEIGSYRLLQELDVPTLQVHSMSDRALLLEDLGFSPRWRLASEDDVASPAVGAAVGRWYRYFHQRGSDFLQGPQPKRSFLQRESDVLTVQTIRETARALGLASNPVWKVAIDCLPLLKTVESSLSATLNYNDFYWTNLAVGCEGGRVSEAVLFDFHLLGIGMRYSDCRNVTGSLGPGAAAAFWAEYGDVDPREELIDRPLSTLHGLVVAARRPQFPAWAHESRELVTNGGLLGSLKAAVEVATEVG
jgi:hypothetical protein